MLLYFSAPTNYDPIGNRKTASEASSNLTYSANSLNQYESISGGANPETPAYDLDGNMTVSKGMVFSYNAENRLIEASQQNPQQGSIKSTYIYDYMGRRAQKTLYTYSSGSWQKQKDISFIYDGWNMVKESEKASDSSPEVSVYYVWGLDLSQSMQGAGGVGGLIASVKSGNEYLYSYDGNGNVGQMVKSSDGSIAASYEYDPFGKTIFIEGPMAAENSYRFSTKYLDDETILYYYGFRFYSVELGRWINRDPMGEAGGLNLYVFSVNNPLFYFDYIGHESKSFDLLMDTAKRFGMSADTLTSNMAGSFNNIVFFPLVDLLSLPDTILKCMFGLTDEELAFFAAEFQLTGFYDDVLIGMVLAGGKAPKIARSVFGSKSTGELYDIASKGADFYVSPGGQAIPARGYRAIGGKSNIAEALEGTISSRNPNPTYITFDNLRGMTPQEVQSLLQLPHLYPQPIIHR